MNPLFKYCLFGLVTALVITGSAQASGKKAGQGFSGHIQPVMGFVSTKSLSSVGDDNKRIDSLDQEAAYETEFLPALLWNLGYTFEGGKTRIWAGSSEALTTRDISPMQIGITQTLGDGTRLSLSYAPALFDEDVWQDPFLVGRDRAETDMSSQGFRMAAASVFGVPLSLGYTFTSIDVDQDLAGASRGLSSAQRASLKRSGKRHQADVSYDIDLGHGFTLSPGAQYTLADADGDANSFDRFGGDLALTYTVGRVTLFASGALYCSEHDASNPVFNLTREDDIYAVSTGITIASPFGLEHISVSLMSMYRQEDSNIGFYDKEQFINGIGVNWSF